METVLLNNNEARVFVYGMCEATGKYETVRPGVAPYDKRFVDEFKNHPVHAEQFADGIFEELTSGKDATNLAKMKPNKALDIVKATTDRDLLKKWAGEEKRPQVQKAIDKQLADIAKIEFRDKKKDGEGEES